MAYYGSVIKLLKDSRDGHWNVLARLTLRDELDLSQRALTYVVISGDKREQDINKLINKWMESNQVTLDRSNKYFPCSLITIALTIRCFSSLFVNYLARLLLGSGRLG